MLVTNVLKQVLIRYKRRISALLPSRSTNDDQKVYRYRIALLVTNVLNVLYKQLSTADQRSI